MEFNCKWCGFFNDRKSFICKSCGKYQNEDKPLHRTKNKIIDIKSMRLFNLDQCIGKTILNYFSDKGYDENSKVVIFTDGSWIEISAELDPFSCSCGFAELTHHRNNYNTKEELIEIGLW